MLKRRNNATSSPVAVASIPSGGNRLPDCLTQLLLAAGPSRCQVRYACSLPIAREDLQTLRRDAARPRRRDD